MKPHDDDRLDAYLWDPGAEPDETVRSLEASLAELRFDPEQAPLALPPLLKESAVPRRRAARKWWLRLAYAPAALLIVGLAFAAWRWTWPAGRAWTVEALPTGVSDRLAVGGTLQPPPSEEALVRVARIGTLRLSGGSLLTLNATRSNRHRLTLEHGSVHVRVWAPPFSVVFDTPSGEVGDVGCEFDLDVDPSSSRVRVTSGWVQLENSFGEVLVPVGASSEMTAGRAPGVPVYDDAAPGFREAVRALEAGSGDSAAAVGRIVETARQRDVLTLLMLVHREVPGRDRLTLRAGELSPPPGDATVEKVLRGDRDALWRWYGKLPLPPTKGWWLRWRDGLPRWLVAKSR
jgi:ferric-dicitrate binding protein FerR (iron transport regulator)